MEVFVAIDTQNLVYLIDPFWQAENNNGKPIVNGYMCVYIAGTDQKYITWQNWDGTRNPFKIPLGSDGRATILVEAEYTYDCYLYDSFGNLVCSRLNVKPNLGGDVYGLSQVYHDETLTGNGTVTSPLGMVSAKLGVQEPLYFVEDDSATVIGLRESAYSGLPYVENSAIGYGMAGMQPFVSSISGLGFYALSASSATIADSASLANSASIANSAENAGLVTSGWETGSDGRITAYNGTAFSAGKVYSGISPVYVDNTNDKIGVSSKDFLANSPLYFTEYSDRVELSISGLPPTPGLMYESGFNYASGKITGYNNSGISAGKVYSGISPITVDNEADTISLASATLGVQAPLFFVEDSESATVIGLNTAQIQIDIPESAYWEDAYSTVNNNSGSWTSAADELAVLNTAKWDSTCDYVSSHSATWNSVNDKLDSQIYASDSGNFLTGLPSDLVYTADIQDMATTGDINDLVTSIAETYQTIDGMTAYATTNYVDSSVSGKYDTSSFSAISGNFLTALPSDLVYTADLETVSAEITGMIPTALTGDYIETSAIKSGQIGTTTLISGFYDGQLSATYAGTASRAFSATEALNATNADSARRAAYVYSGWGNTSLFGTDSAIKQYLAVTGNVQGSPAGILYKFNAYSADSATVADSADRALKDSNGNIIAMTYLTAHQSLPQSADWDSAASTVSAGYVYWDAAYGTLTANSANWARISELSGYSANGWSARSNNRTIIASAKTFTANGIPGTLTGYLTVSGGVSTWSTLADGSIYLYNTARNNSAQYIRPDTIVKWNNYASGKLDTTATANFYTTANESGFITGVPAGTMNESNFGYDASNNITAYNGSAFKAGDEFPQSATDAIEAVTANSADWNSTTNTVSSNSGAWGGSGIEISAGFGIDIQLIDNKLVFSLATATGDI